jgi:hypothetical protein
MLTTYKPDPIFTFLFASPDGMELCEFSTRYDLAMMIVSRRAKCRCGELTLLPTPVELRFDWEMKMIDRGMVPATTAYYPIKLGTSDMKRITFVNKENHDLDEEWILETNRHGILEWHSKWNEIPISKQTPEQFKQTINNREASGEYELLVHE